jgi:hypothetical protein
MTDTIALEDPRTLRVGDQRWPVSYSEVSEFEIPRADTSRPVAPVRRRQAVIAFESGWQISVLWDTLSHSDNHDTFYADEPFTDEPTCVEVGLLWQDGGLVGVPFSYTDAETLNDMLTTVSRWPSDAGVIDTLKEVYGLLETEDD